MRKIAFLLALVTLLSACFVSCTNNGNANTDTTTNGSATTTTQGNNSGDVTNPVEDLYSDLPTGSYNDDVFTFLLSDLSWCDYDTVYVETTNGDLVNDEVYKRNTYVEDMLKIQIEESVKSASDALTTLRTMKGSNDNLYNCYYGTAGQCNTMALEGLLVDMNDMTEINQTKPWWDSGFNDALKINDSSYVLFGDMNVTYVGGTFALGFNTNLITEYRLNSPYEHYQNGTWTWDTMYQMLEVVSEDVNGDGSYHTFDSDIFGLVGHANQIRCFIMSSGIELTTRNANGIPELNSDQEAYTDAYREMMNKFVLPENCLFKGCTLDKNLYDEYNTSNIAASATEGYVQIFNDGRSLFHLNGISAFKACRNASVPYGLVCIPKYKATQQDYISVKYSGVGGVAIPAGFDEDGLSMNATVVECMAAYSYKYVTPAFVEITLYYKYAKDEQSVNILKSLIENTGYCDLAFLYDWAGISSNIQKQSEARRTEISAFLGGIKSKFDRAAESTYDMTAQTP